MSRTVHCCKYQKLLEGLAFPPFPGAAGEHIFNTVSKQAWLEWLNHQTTLINEKRLNVMQPETRSYLALQRELFLHNGEVEVAEGFVRKDSN